MKLIILLDSCKIFTTLIKSYNKKQVASIFIIKYIYKNKYDWHESNVFFYFLGSLIYKMLTMDKDPLYYFDSHLSKILHKLVIINFEYNVVYYPLVAKIFYV